MRIAMWSGPRNLSTALMRSFEARGDCAVVDEPFYACYLQETQLEHPGFLEVIASQSTSWSKVAKFVGGEIPNGKRFWYQKHMTHHMLKGVDREWFSKLRHAFLIRKPELVVASYSKTRSQMSISDLGFMQQAEIFDYVHSNLNQSPIVVDSDDLLKNPGHILSLLCSALDIPFSSNMLHWKTGRRASDGVWAKYWYHNVEASTGFAPWSQRELMLSKQDVEMVDRLQSYYQKLWVHRLC